MLKKSLDNKEKKQTKKKGSEEILISERMGSDVQNVVHVARTAKVVKGGKRFGFRALVVVGNGQGRVGAAIGKANQVQIAIQKASNRAKKCMIEFPMTKQGTIPHEIIADFGASRIWIKPAAEGTGVIAGAGARAVLEAGGIRNILSKNLGSSNPCNMVYATVKALSELKSKKNIMTLRGKNEKNEKVEKNEEKAESK